MANRVDTKNLDRTFKNLIKNIKSTQNMKKLGGFAIKTIRDRTRNEGKGVSRSGGNLRKLRNVSDEWAIRRQAFKRHPKAASGTSSNLTFQGTMLDSMILKSVKPTGFFIGFRTGKEADKAEGNEARGRPFMYLGAVEIRDAATFVKKNILKGI